MTGIGDAEMTFTSPYRHRSFDAKMARMCHMIDTCAASKRWDEMPTVEELARLFNWRRAAVRERLRLMYPDLFAEFWRDGAEV